MVLCVLRDACHELFCVFENFCASGTQNADVTKSLGLTTTTQHGQRFYEKDKFFKNPCLGCLSEH